MRYTIVSRGLSLQQMEAEVLKAGATGVKKTRLLNQLFCELTPEQAAALSRVPGLVMKAVKGVKTDQVLLEAPSVESISDVFYLLRSYFTPPLTGAGLTVAVLDTGIRKSHEAFQGGKIVYEANFTESPGTDDVFGHGTQVAFVVAGGRHALGQDAGVSPGARLMNIKVIGDDGVATEENVILGIDEVCDLAQQARTNGLLPTGDMYPNVINLSLGGEDDGDLDNPLRVACRQAVEVYGLDVIAAAGNSGPKMTTVMLPACEPAVIAVGALETNVFDIWEKSSRGPTAEGETKPDFALWGTDIRMASSKADDEYVAKSGTSFSAPMLSGLTGLVWESGRRAYGEGWPFSWYLAREMALYYCVKPSEAPLKKDNSYGYGLPAMSAMLGEVARIQTPMEQMVAPMTMMLMAMMMTRILI